MDSERRDILDMVNVGIWVEDFSDVLDLLDELRRAGIVDLRAHFDRDPQHLTEAIRRIRVKDVNRFAVEMFEASGREMLKDSLLRIFVPETMPLLEDELVTLWEGGRRLRGETKLCTLGGRRFDAIVTIAFEGDRCENTLVTLLDITDKKQASEARELYTRRLEALCRATKAIAAEPDFDRMMQTVTDAATELAGAKFGAFFYNAVDDQGERYLLYALSGAPREDFEKLGVPRKTELFDTTFRGLGAVRSDDIREDPRYGRNPPHLGMPEGHLPVVSYLAVPVVSRTGEVLGGLFFGHDKPSVFTPETQALVETIASHTAIAIDNARLIQDARTEIERRRGAERSAQRLAAIVESSEDAIWAKDLTGRITNWNAGAERLLGYSAAEMVGQPVTELIPEDHRTEEREILARVRAGNRVHPFDTVRLGKDGSLVDVSVSVSPIKDATGAVVGASTIARDVSERKQAEEKRRLLFREMNHRIRNLFAVSGSLVSLSARSATTPQELADTARRRLNALAKAHSLTLPSLDEDDSLNRSIGLHELATTILAPFSDVAGGNIRIRGSDLLVAGSAATNLALLLHEFATNATKYGALSTVSGQVTLDIRVDGNNISLEWKESGGPKLMVSDDHEGFGTFLGRATVEGQLGGRIAYDWRDEGLQIALNLPRDCLTRS